MLNQFSRTELLLGKEAMERLSRARVAVFGIGGVGAIDLIDDDKVCLTNLNRQIIATRTNRKTTTSFPGSPPITAIR